MSLSYKGYALTHEGRLELRRKLSDLKNTKIEEAKDDHKKYKNELSKKEKLRRKREAELYEAGFDRLPGKQIKCRECNWQGSVFGSGIYRHYPDCPLRTIKNS